MHRLIGLHLFCKGEECMTESFDESCNLILKELQESTWRVSQTEIERLINTILKVKNIRLNNVKMINVAGIFLCNTLSPKLTIENSIYNYCLMKTIHEKTCNVLHYIII